MRLKNFILMQAWQIPFGFYNYQDFGVSELVKFLAEATVMKIEIEVNQPKIIFLGQ